MDTTIVNELAATKARIIIINNLDWEAASKELFKGEHGKPVYPSPVKGGRFKICCRCFVGSNPTAGTIPISPNG